MTRRLLPVFLLAVSAATCTFAQDDKYSGPVPPQADVLYLLHASRLLPTEIGEAKEETRKEGSAFVIPSAASPARTPMSEPIFILKASKIDPMRLELYKMEVRNGQREVVISGKKRKDATRPLHLTVSPLGGGLYRVEVSETLANGQYSLTPNGSNQVFCFEVY